MREDAKTELWMPMRIGDIQGWFSDMRIERSSVPEWMHFWELSLLKRFLHELDSSIFTVCNSYEMEAGVIS